MFEKVKLAELPKKITYFMLKFKYHNSRDTLYVNFSVFILGHNLGYESKIVIRS